MTPSPSCRALTSEWAPPIERNISFVGPTQVRFLNQDGSIETAAQWNNPVRDKLWLYNLHYFDDLNAGDAAARDGWHRSLVDRWIAENAPGQGNGWEAYPTSLRIVNWIKWALNGTQFEESWRDSLAVQARWLERRIEWHLLGNHLLANAKALVFAGLFFEGPEAERWLSRGFDIYRQQLPEQILADGGHFERSPMYHAIILEDILDVLNVARAFGFEDSTLTGSWRTMIERMQLWLRAMTHPDGQISFFNDAAFGIAATPGAVDSYARRLGFDAAREQSATFVNLSDSGYVRLQIDDAVVIIDVAPIGPDYLPGHAHADTLSFEFSLGLERVVVNGGTSVYGNGSQRQRERSTAAHSTVEIDEENSSEVWSGFRVARRARVRDLSVCEQPNSVTVTAAHDGYGRLAGKPIHRRRWTLQAGNLVVTDIIDGRYRRAVARFHLGSGLKIDANGKSGTIISPSNRRLGWQASVPASAEASHWHPEFGTDVPTECLAIVFDGPHIETVFTW